MESTPEKKLKITTNNLKIVQSEILWKNN